MIDRFQESKNNTVITARVEYKVFPLIVNFEILLKEINGYREYNLF